jgi:cysteine desulfurase
MQINLFSQTINKAPGSRIYFDHASATPVKNEAIEEFVKVAGEYFANASSIHTEGEKSKELLDKLRKDFSYLIRAKKSEVHFVSSPTEANNIFIQGVVKKYLNAGKVPHIITSLAEHSSILEPVLAMQKLGAEVTFLQPNEIGKIDVLGVKESIKKNTVLICLSQVNSETGTIQDIRRISLLVSEHTAKMQEANPSYKKPLVYTDSTQAVENIGADVGSLLCDGMTFGARKLGGLGGVAALFIKRGVELENITFGGGQEGGFKPGTENPGLIASFYKVASLVLKRDSENYTKVAELKTYLIERLKGNFEDEQVKIIGDTRFSKNKEGGYYYKKSSPHILLLQIPNILGEELVLRLDAKGIAVSTASACSLLEGSGSNFLKSLGQEKEAKETIRLSFSTENTKTEIDYFIQVLQDILNKYQKASN